MKDRQLIIIGAGGHGKVAADIALCMGYTDVAFLDDRASQTLRIIGPSDSWKDHIETADLFVAIGNAKVRQRLTQQMLSGGATVVNLIHPRAVVAQSATLGHGVLIAPGAVVGVDAVIGDGVIVNTCASVDHDSVVGAYCHIAVGAHIAGTVHIGECTMVGAGAAVINNVDITDNVMVGGGACVVKTIDVAGTYVGVPAKRISSNL